VSQERSAKATAASPRKSPNPRAAATAARFGGPTAAARGRSPAPPLDGASPRLGGTFRLTTRQFDISYLRYIVVAREPMGGERSRESAMPIFDFQRREGAVSDGPAPSRAAFAAAGSRLLSAFLAQSDDRTVRSSLARARVRLYLPTDRSVRSDSGAS
jgi:hypothetical protein